MLAYHWLKSWSKAQSLIALSLAESELYAAVKATAETMGIQSMARDFAIQSECTILADASAALRIISRKGLGKVRQLDANHLWIQQVAAQKRVKYEKVAGSVNPADLMTKELAAADVDKYVAMMNAQYAEGRPEIASKVAQDVQRRTGKTTLANQKRKRSKGIAVIVHRQQQ